MSVALTGLKRFIFWDFPRAGWQYDVMVGVILVFIFLTPRSWFRDQPRASSVVMLPVARGGHVYWIEPELLAGVPEAQWIQKASSLLAARTQKHDRVKRLEPIFDSEDEIKGFMAYVEP